MFLKVVLLFVFLNGIVARSPLNSMESGQQIVSMEYYQANATKFNYPPERVSRSTSVGSKTFYLEFARLNFFKALQQCAAHDWQLARIESAQEQAAVEKLINDYAVNHEHFWIAGNDLGYYRQFFWMTTGKPVVYKNWNYGEPNDTGNQGEHCMHLDGTNDLKWNDAICVLEFYYLCEKLVGNGSLEFLASYF